jgi:hypothetical protein
MQSKNASDGRIHSTREFYLNVSPITIYLAVAVYRAFKIDLRR